MDDVVAVVGLGDVGLPLAVAFGKIMPTIGYDLSMPKLDSYRQHTDPSGTVSDADLLSRPLADCLGKVIPGGCFVDVKARFDGAALTAAGLNVWRL